MRLTACPVCAVCSPLFEGVATGAADGYGRMAGKPAMTLLHLGPGFANGVANLHNARRAGTPIFNVIGHHATWIRNYDPPLNSEVEQLAGVVSSWVRTNDSARHLSRDTAHSRRRHPGARWPDRHSRGPGRRAMGRGPGHRCDATSNRHLKGDA